MRGSALPRLTALDSRLANAINAPNSCRFHQLTGLSSFVDWVPGYAQDRERLGGVEVVDLYCHGNAVDGQLGYGAQFCTEGISLRTMDLLAPLCGKVGRIDCHACGFDYTELGRDRRHGDGNHLCLSLATRLQRRVKASTAIQYGRVHTTGPVADVLDPRPWRGDVLTIDSRGMLVGMES